MRPPHTHLQMNITHSTVNIKDLYGAFQKGDEEAFDILFEKYYPMFCAYAQRFVTLEDAEEIVQDVMLWLYANRQVLVIESSLDGYIFKMIYRRCLNKIASQEVKQRVDTLFFEHSQSLLCDIDTVLIDELSKKIREAVAALPESYREAFVLNRFKEMTYKEIAAIMDVSVKTIDYRIQQALKILRIDLKDYLPLLFLLGVL